MNCAHIAFHTFCATSCISLSCLELLSVEGLMEKAKFMRLQSEGASNLVAQCSSLVDSREQYSLCTSSSSLVADSLAVGQSMECWNNQEYKREVDTMFYTVLPYLEPYLRIVEDNKGLLQQPTQE